MNVVVIGNFIDVLINECFVVVNVVLVGCVDCLILICCVIFDFIGLLLSFGEIEEFLEDLCDDVKVFEKVVEWLFDLFYYGEWWVWYWFDVVCYVDFFGFVNDYEWGNVWCYCDYVVCVFNEDKFYD